MVGQNYQASGLVLGFECFLRQNWVGGVPHKGRKG